MATAPAQAIVVCLEPDGTIAFEAFGDSDACSPGASEDGPATEVEDLGGDCCACIDIPLPTQGEEPRLKPAGFDLAAQAIAPPASAGPVFASLTELLLGRPLHPRPGPSRSLASVRSLVLRI
jgi:hypothetical protein